MLHFEHMTLPPFLQLLVDGWKSLKGGQMSAGYGTAKFTEGVYEALPEVTIQVPPCPLTVDSVFALGNFTNIQTPGGHTHKEAGFT